MNREEILKMNRAAQQDEGLFSVAAHGHVIASSLLSLISTILIVFNWITGQPNHIPLCLLFAMLAADSFPYYRFTGRKRYLSLSLLAGVVSIAFLIAHMIQVVMLG